MFCYLDNNASTQPCPGMLEQITKIVQGKYANPSSPHSFAEEAKGALALARRQVASALGCNFGEVVFTSGGTEANGIALQAAPELGETVACSAVEHPSVSRCAIEKVKVSPEGFIDCEHLEEVVLKLRQWSPRVIVAVMYANNETGVLVDPFNKVSSICEKHGVHLHIDAVQAFGKVPLDINSLGADTLSISAHKAHGLKGVGALFIRDGFKPAPAFCGGSHEFGFRPGTENQIGILSLGYVSEKIQSKEYQDLLSQVKIRRDNLEDMLADISEVNGSREHRLDNTSNLYFPDVPDNDLLIDELQAAGVYVSGKSACSSGMPTPSRVLRAMYGDQSDRHEKSIRVSLSVYTTDEEIEYAAKTIRKVVEDLSNL